jgi:hypothetical protein
MKIAAQQASSGERQLPPADRSRTDSRRHHNPVVFYFEEAQCNTPRSVPTWHDGIIGRKSIDRCEEIDLPVSMSFEMATF